MGSDKTTLEQFREATAPLQEKAHGACDSTLEDWLQSNAAEIERALEWHGTRGEFPREYHYRVVEERDKRIAALEAKLKRTLDTTRESLRAECGRLEAELKEAKQSAFREVRRECRKYEVVEDCYVVPAVWLARKCGED